MMEYQSNDIWLVAYMTCQGAKLERLIQGKGKRKIFVVTWQAAALTQAVSDYHRGAARVDPRELRHKLADLKGLLSSRAVLPPKRKDKQDGTSSSDESASAE